MLRLRPSRPARTLPGEIRRFRALLPTQEPPVLRLHASRLARALSGEIRCFLRRSAASVTPVSLRKGRCLSPAEAHTWFFALFPAPRSTASVRLPRSRHRGLRGFSRLLSRLKGVRGVVNAASLSAPVRAPRRSTWQEIRLRRKRPTPETAHPEQGRSTEDRKPGTGLGGER